MKGHDLIFVFTLRNAGPFAGGVFTPRTQSVDPYSVLVCVYELIFQAHLIPCRNVRPPVSLSSLILYAGFLLPEHLTLILSLLSPSACLRRPYKSSATANFGCLVSLYGDERRGLAPPSSCERGACTNLRRCSPFASIFGSEFNKNRKEGREEERDGMADEDFPPILKTHSESGWHMNIDH